MSNETPSPFDDDEKKERPLMERLISAIGIESRKTPEQKAHSEKVLAAIRDEMKAQGSTLPTIRKRDGE